MRALFQHPRFPYYSVAILFVASAFFAVLFGTPVWASWTQNPAPIGFEGATIYDTVLIQKDPSLTPVGIPYVGWAVGKLNDSGGAVIFYYNGSSWSRVFSDASMGALKAVDARYTGIISEVIAVGDFTVGSTTTATANYNTILYGENNVFSIQTYDGSLASPQTCNPVFSATCKSWVGSETDHVGLTGAAFTDNANIKQYNGGVCNNETNSSSDGFYIVGQRGALLVGQRCYERSGETAIFKMFVVTNERDPTYGYYKNLFTAPEPDIASVTADYTALTRTQKNVYFLSAQPESGSKPRLFKFSTSNEKFGLREVHIPAPNTALNNRVITDISAVQKTGPAATSAGNPWQLFMSTESGGAPASGVVYAEVSGTTSGLSASVLTALSTDGVPINDTAVAVTYRGGEMVVNGDFEGQSEINANLPNGWGTSGYMPNFDDIARPMVKRMDNPAAGGVGASGKVLQLTSELMLSNDAAIHFYTDDLVTEATAKKNTITGIRGPIDWDADELLSANTDSGRSFRVSGFFKTTGLSGYDFRLTYDPTAKARLYIGEQLASSAHDFTHPVVDGWSFGPGSATGSVTFTSTVGAEILNSETMGNGSGIKRAGNYYPFVLEYDNQTTTGSGRTLKLEWKPKDSTDPWRTVDWALQVGNMNLKRGGSQQTNAWQVLDQTRGAGGPVYRVRGKYRVAAAPKSYYSLDKLDPRHVPRGWGGLYLNCRNSDGKDWGNCGFKWDIIVDPKSENDTLSTDWSTGGWRSFDFLISKTATEKDTALEIMAIAEYGVTTWIDDISVEPFQETALASAPQYHVVAVSGDGGIGTILEAKGEDPSILSLKRTQVYASPSSLESVALAAPNKGVIAGTNSLLLDLMPGDVRGWGWVGTTTNSGSNDPLGWISFSCADVGLCNEHQMTYGVDIGEAFPASTLHPFSGAAWFGTTDANQVREIPGTIIRKDNYCSGDSSYICTHAMNESGTPMNPDTFCGNKGLGTCSFSKPQEYRCSSARSFSSCSISCATHPFGCSSVGWLSFERNADPLLSTGRPPAAPYSYAGNGTTDSYTATFDENFGQVQGWARFLSLKKEATDENSVTAGGWVKFQGPATTVAGPLTDCEACTVTGTKISCDICSATTAGANAFCLGAESCTGGCESEPTRDCTNNLGCDADDDCMPLGTCSDNITICVNDNQCPDDGTCNNKSYECDSPSPPGGPAKTCYQWGTALDKQNNSFVGWAWSEDVGWIDMSRVRIGNPAWFQTLQGNIFSANNVGDVTNQNPVGSCNATYRITAVGQLVNVCSASQQAYLSSPFEEEGVENLILPSSGLETVFGAVDLKGIVNDTNGDYRPPATARSSGRYGEVVNLNEGSELSDLTTALHGSGLVLNRKVYFYCGSACGNPDLTIDGGRINNGSGGGSGNGLLVVYGDLTISEDLTYQQASVSTVEQLASLGVIVFGDLKIRSDVQQFVGAYYVPGNPLFGQPSDPLGREGGSIIIEGGQVSAQQLVQHGLMIAKNFQFLRKFGGSATSPEPAERIIYDGRVVANPPPGFTTLQKALPIVRQIIP